MPIINLDDKAIFNVARKIDSPEGRREYLEQTCGHDTALIERIETLLRGFEKQSQFLEAPAVDLQRTFIAPQKTELPGTEIGTYKIREQLGEGGMGIVYVAEQTEPVRRKVALKIIKPGMDSKEVIARFEAERQALAMMSHPNIAKILDGGTTDTGRPYFVMELVKGIPITEYCDQQRLDMRQRLELFATVCQAVQHAHQKGIIHRDLKPSNVLVELHDVAPVPKVIDFGIAKAVNQQLTQQTVYTQFAQLVGTPLYMSPEQAQLSGMDVDTRSDVYSLGVLLYELLTGITPFDESTLSSVGLDEMRRIIREDEPVRPSYKVSTIDNELMSTISDRRNTDARQLSLSMRRELDWIVMRALEKDRTRRYESPSALAQDIQRYLEDEPVQACPPSVGYRLQKYAKRHKGLLTTAALMLVTLLLATGVSVAYAVQADQARDDANQQTSKAVAAQKQAIESKKLSEANLTAALDAVDKLLGHASSPELREIPQAHPIRQKILEDVLAFYENFKITTGDSAALRFRAALTWASLGGFGDELHETDLARKGYDEALRLLEELVKQSPNEWEYQSYFLNVSQGYGWFHMHSSQREQAQKYFERVRTRADELLLKADVDQPQWIRRQLIRRQVQSRLGLAAVAKASRDDDVARELILAAYRLTKNDFDAIPPQDSVSLLRGLAELHHLSDPDLADQYYREGIQRSRSILNDNPSRFKKSWHAGFLDAASQFFQKTDPAFSEELEKESLSLSEKLASEFSYLLNYHRHLAQKLAARADPIVRLTQAIKRYPEISWYYAYRGSVHRVRDEYELALADLNRAIELNPDDDYGYVVAAAVYAEMKQYTVAIAEYDKAIELNPQNAWTWCDRAKLRMHHFQRYDEALLEFNKAIELSPIPHFFSQRAIAYVHFKQFDNAVVDLVKSIDLDPKKTNKAGAYNTFARLRIDCPDPSYRNPAQALEMATKAVETAQGNADHRNTLGHAQYVSGDFAGAIKSCTTALELGPVQECRSFFLLAMSHWQLDEHDAAQTWYAKATQSLSNNPSTDERLDRLRKETEALIGSGTPTSSVTDQPLKAPNPVSTPD